MLRNSHRRALSPLLRLQACAMSEHVDRWTCQGVDKSITCDSSISFKTMSKCLEGGVTIPWQEEVDKIRSMHARMVKVAVLERP